MPYVASAVQTEAIELQSANNGAAAASSVSDRDSVLSEATTAVNCGLRPAPNRTIASTLAGDSTAVQSAEHTSTHSLVTRRSWVWLKHTITVQNCIWTVVAGILAVLGYRYITWTALKEFRDDCRATYGATKIPMSGACRSALSGSYMRPPFSWSKLNEDAASSDESTHGVSHQKDGQISYSNKTERSLAFWKSVPSLDTIPVSILADLSRPLFVLPIALTVGAYAGSHRKASVPFLHGLGCYYFLAWFWNFFPFLDGSMATSDEGYTSWEYQPLLYRTCLIICYAFGWFIMRYRKSSFPWRLRQNPPSRWTLAFAVLAISRLCVMVGYVETVSLEQWSHWLSILLFTAALYFAHSVRIETPNGKEEEGVVPLLVALTLL